MASVMTVLGPVPATDLGVTLAHEHLLLDLSCLWSMPRDPVRRALVDAQVTADLYDRLRSDPYHCRDNMHLDSVAIAAEELAHFAALGGRTVIDLSTRAIGPYPQELAAIARRTGLHIVAGCGFYTRRAHPAWVREASEEELADVMIADLTTGFATTIGSAPPQDGTGTGIGDLAGQLPLGAPEDADRPIRAGIIGEIGTSSPIHPDEERVLRAAVRAHLATGAAINVHLSIFAQEGLRVLDILEQAGADARRVALSHLDENLDADYHLAIARRGAFLEFDTFGSECAFAEDNVREPSDDERIAALLRLLDAGYERQVLLSQDVCTKMQWRRLGGRGYDHLLRSVVPRVRSHGVPESAMTAMLVQNPARLLGGEEITAPAIPPA